MKKALCLVLAVLSAAAFLFPTKEGFASSAPVKKEFSEIDVFGTYVEAVLYGDDENSLDNAFNEVIAVFREIENAVSVKKASSDISRFNILKSDDGINYIENASGHTVALLKSAKQFYNLSNGAFNPCAFLLNELWQLSPRFSGGGFPLDFPYDRAQQELPEQIYVDEFRKLMNFNEVIVEEFEDGGNRITKRADSVVVEGVRYDMKIDLGAIAKGYACDKAEEILKRQGIKTGMLSLGGSSQILLGNPQKSSWTVGLAAPDYSGFYTHLEINGSLSTSGDYQNYLTVDGIRYCHIMNTKTGAPIRTNIRTASAFGENLSGAEADALSTAVMAMDFETAKAFVNSPEIASRGIKIIFVYEKQWLLGSVLEVIVNTAKGFVSLQKLDYRLCGFVNDAGNFVYNPLMLDLWFWLTAASLAAAIAVLVINRRRRGLEKQSGTSPAEIISSLKTQKFFLKKDLFIYAFLIVLVTVLLIVFVFAPKSEAVAQLKIYHRNMLIYSYDFESEQGEMRAADFSDKITVTTISGKTEVKIEIDGHYNIVTFEKKSAKVTDADCSLRKDCVNAFPAITQAEQTIICQPHYLKIVGTGVNENGILTSGY